MAPQIDSETGIMGSAEDILSLFRAQFGVLSLNEEAKVCLSFVLFHSKYLDILCNLIINFTLLTVDYRCSRRFERNYGRRRVFEKETLLVSFSHLSTVLFRMLTSLVDQSNTEHESDYRRFHRY